MPQFSVIVVNYNAGEHLGRCIEALARQTCRDFELIVVDNASTDGSLERYVPKDHGALPFPVTVMRMKKNLGFAAANNQGAEEAKGEWLALLNPDAFAEEGWLEECLTAIEKYPDTAMFGSTQLEAEDLKTVDGAGDLYHAFGVPWRAMKGCRRRQLPRHDVEVFAPCAAAAVIRKSAFQQAKGFDEAFFCYCEDIDLGFRLRLMGERCVQLRKAVVAHVGSAITGKESEFSAFHGARNRFRVFVKNMPWPLFWPLLPFFLLTQGVLILWAAPQGVTGPTVRGVIAALTEPGYLWQARREAQSRRRAGWWRIAAALSWSPLKLARRSGNLTPVRQRGAS